MSLLEKFSKAHSMGGKKRDGRGEREREMSTIYIYTHTPPPPFRVRQLDSIHLFSPSSSPLCIEGLPLRCVFNCYYQDDFVSRFGRYAGTERDALARAGDICRIHHG